MQSITVANYSEQFSRPRSSSRTRILGFSDDFRINEDALSVSIPPLDIIRRECMCTLLRNGTRLNVDALGCCNALSSSLTSSFHNALHRNINNENNLQEVVAAHPLGHPFSFLGCTLQAVQLEAESSGSCRGLTTPAGVVVCARVIRLDGGCLGWNSWNDEWRVCS